MSSIYLEIEKFRNNQLLQMYKMELLDPKTTTERINELNKLSSVLVREKKSEKNNLEKIYKKYDLNQYYQLWKHLTDLQKTIKIKEFNNNLTDDEISILIHNKTKTIKYDSVQGKIIEIM